MVRLAVDPARRAAPSCYAPPVMSPPAAAALAGLFGLPFGSFATVVIRRVPRRQSLWRPGSRCPSCEAPIAWRDNLPLLGWLLLRGRCRRCRAAIPLRYPVVELATALLWALVTWRLVGAGLGAAVPAYLALTFVCVALTAIDLDVRLLPDRITFPAFAVVGLLLLAASLALGDPGRMGRALLGALMALVFFSLLYLIYPAGMGFGDVKFAPTLGMALGWLSWPVLVVGFFLAFLIGGLVGIVAMLVLRVGRKAAIPFGPWMAAGALLAVLVGTQIANWYLGGLSGA
jgi:leader peptidase (prepilin peptidase) / N-methyltransferase